MRKKKKPYNISTLLGEGVRIEGQIEFSDTIRLDGSVKGKIHGAEGTLIVGEKAVIEADIHVGTAIIMGVVNGSLTANERIEVYPPGRVTGDIQAPAVVLEKGVVFNGSCAMVSRTLGMQNAEQNEGSTMADNSREAPLIKA